MSTLRTAVIRLAYSGQPELREHLLPLLMHRQGSTYQEYVERKKKERDDPLSKEDWEARQGKSHHDIKKIDPEDHAHDMADQHMDAKHEEAGKAHQKGAMHPLSTKGRSNGHADERAELASTANKLTKELQEKDKS